MSDYAPTHGQRQVQPEIPRSRFALGMARYPADMEDLRLGRFSDGQRAQPSHEPRLHRGRFSEGQELLGDDMAEKHLRRRFSEGVETRGSTG